MTSHAYLLVRDTGNILFYSSGLHEEHQHIRTLWRLTYQYLSHSDAAGPALAEIKNLFGSKLCCQRFDEPAVRKVTPVDCTFDKAGQHRGHTNTRSHPWQGMLSPRVVT